VQKTHRIKGKKHRKFTCYRKNIQKIRKNTCKIIGIVIHYNYENVQVKGIARNYRRRHLYQGDLIITYRSMINAKKQPKREESFHEEKIA
jgi:hypothetical protein